MTQLLHNQGQYGYADDLAILLSKPLWEAVEERLSKDMNTLSSYLKNWCLKLSAFKTVSSMFHLYNKETSRKMNIMVDNTRLKYQAVPTSLGVKLDRTLSFRKHLDKVMAKTTSRAALIRRLASTSWGASTKTLRISTKTLVFSSAEYCAPVWCHSPHFNKLDTALNTARRNVTGVSTSHSNKPTARPRRNRSSRGQVRSSHASSHSKFTGEWIPPPPQNFHRDTTAHAPQVLAPLFHTRPRTAPHNIRLPGSRQNGTSGSQWNHLGYTTTSKTPRTSLASRLPRKQ